MINRRQYIINTITNYVVYLSNILVALLLSPFVVRSLGDVYYGVWAIIVAFTGYYGLMDMGLRQGTAQYVSRYLSSKEYIKLNTTVNSSLVMLSTVGTIILIVSLVVSFLFSDDLIKHSPEDHSVQLAFFILGVGISLRFPFMVFQAIINGKHRYDISGLIAFVAKIIHGLTVYLVLRSGYGIMGLAIATAGSQILEGFLMMVAAKILVPELRLKPSLPALTTIKEIMDYGIYNFIFGISMQTILYIGPMILGKMLGPEIVTYYVIGANLIPYYGSLIGIISIPLLQVIIAKDVKDEHEDVKKLYLSGTRYTNLLTTYVAFVLIILGKPFLGVWMGYKYVNSNVCSSSLIMSILALSQMIDLSQTIGRQILFGIRKHKFLAVVSVCSAIITSVTTVLLVLLFSAYGAAIALLMQSVIVNGYLLPSYICKKLEISICCFYKYSVIPNLIYFAVSFCIFYIVLEDLTIKTWGSIIFYLILITVLYIGPGGYLIFGKKIIKKMMVKAQKFCLG